MDYISRPKQYMDIIQGKNDIFPIYSFILISSKLYLLFLLKVVCYKKTKKTM